MNNNFNIVLITALVLITHQFTKAQTRLPLPNERQLAWQKAELGVVFHYDLHVFDGEKYNQGRNRITPIADYNIFNPTHLDVEQWVLTAKAAGARFAILTATHETGFALFQSEYNPYSLKAVEWGEGKRDIVREFVDACRKHELEPGIYIGIRWNSFFGVHDFVVDGEGKMQENRQQYYNKMVEGMVTEICTNYGPLFKIWFDGGASHPEKGAPDVLSIVQKYQPNCLFYHNNQLAEARWGGSETGTVGYPCWATFPFAYTGSGESAPKGIADNGFALLKHGDPDGKYWMPAMSDAPLRGYNGRHEWFWEPHDEKHIFPLQNLVDMYYKSVGRNSTLILGLTPGPDGLMPEQDAVRMKEFGEEIRRRFNKPIHREEGTGNTIEINLHTAADINQIVLQENIANGEKVRRFLVEVKVHGRWQALFEGESIGQKFIYVLPEKIKSEHFRIRVTEAIGRPELTFLMYYI